MEPAESLHIEKTKDRETSKVKERLNAIKM